MDAFNDPAVRAEYAEYLAAKGTFSAAYSSLVDELRVVCIKADNTLAELVFKNPRAGFKDVTVSALQGTVAPGSRISLVARPAYPGSDKNTKHGELFQFYCEGQPGILDSRTFYDSTGDWRNFIRYSDAIKPGTYMAAWWPATSMEPIVYLQDPNGKIRDVMLPPKPNNLVNAPEYKTTVPLCLHAVPNDSNGTPKAVLTIMAPDDHQPAKTSIVQLDMAWDLGPHTINNASHPTHAMPDGALVTGISALSADTFVTVHTEAKSLARLYAHGILGSMVESDSKSNMVAVAPQLAPGAEIVRFDESGPNHVIYVSTPLLSLVIRKSSDASGTVIPAAREWFGRPQISKERMIELGYINPPTPAPAPIITPSPVIASAGALVAKGTFSAAYSPILNEIRIVCIKADCTLAEIIYEDVNLGLDKVTVRDIPGKAAEGSRIGLVARPVKPTDPNAGNGIFYWFFYEEEAGTPVARRLHSADGDWNSYMSYVPGMILHGTHFAAWWPATADDPSVYVQDQKGQLRDLNYLNMIRDPADPSKFISPPTYGTPIPLSVNPVSSDADGIPKAILSWAPPDAATPTISRCEVWYYRTPPKVKPVWSVSHKIDASAITVDIASLDYDAPMVLCTSKDRNSQGSSLYAQAYGRILSESNLKDTGVQPVQPQVVPGIAMVRSLNPSQPDWLLHVTSPGLDLVMRTGEAAYGNSIVISAAKGWFGTPAPVQDVVVKPQPQPQPQPQPPKPVEPSRKDPPSILVPSRPPQPAVLTAPAHFCKEVIMPHSKHTATRAAAINMGTIGNGDSSHNHQMAVMAPQEKLWSRGESPVLRYAFLPGKYQGTEQQRVKVRTTITTWSMYANLAFVDVTGDATATSDIRIYFDPADGSWSLVGSDCSDAKASEATMNLGWVEDTPDTEPKERAVILHEFGHVLGMLHEHQSPAHTGGQSVIDASAAVKFYMDTQDQWTEDMVWQQIISVLALKDVSNFSEVDTSSIMHYSFPASVTGGAAIEYVYKLSPLDKAFAVINYPRSPAAEAAMAKEKEWTLEYALGVVGIAKADPETAKKILAKRDEITDDDISPLAELRDLFSGWTRAAHEARLKERGESGVAIGGTASGGGAQKGIEDKSKYSTTPITYQELVARSKGLPGASVKCDKVDVNSPGITCGGGIRGLDAKEAKPLQSGKSHAINDVDVLASRDFLKLRNGRHAGAGVTRITWTINWRPTANLTRWATTQGVDDIRPRDDGYCANLIIEAFGEGWGLLEDLVFEHVENPANLDDVDLVFCFQDDAPSYVDTILAQNKAALSRMFVSYTLVDKRRTPPTTDDLIDIRTLHRQGFPDRLAAGWQAVEDNDYMVALEPAIAYDICIRTTATADINDTGMFVLPPPHGQIWGSRDAAKRIINHEVGHFLGLDHENISPYCRILRVAAGAAPGPVGLMQRTDAELRRIRLQIAVGEIVAGKLDQGSVMDVRYQKREPLYDSYTYHHEQDPDQYGFYSVVKPNKVDLANMRLLYPGKSFTNDNGQLIDLAGGATSDLFSSKLGLTCQNLDLPSTFTTQLAALATQADWAEMRKVYLDGLSHAQQILLQRIQIFDDFTKRNIAQSELYTDAMVRTGVEHLKWPTSAVYFPGSTVVTSLRKIDPGSCELAHTDVDYLRRPTLARVDHSTAERTRISFAFADGFQGETITLETKLARRLAEDLSSSWRAPFFELNFTQGPADIIIAFQSEDDLPKWVRPHRKYIRQCYALPARCGNADIVLLQQARENLRPDRLGRASAPDDVPIAARPAVIHDICYRLALNNNPTADVQRQQYDAMLRGLNGAIGHFLGLTHSPVGLIASMYKLAVARGRRVALPAEMERREEMHLGKALLHVVNNGALSPATIARYFQGSVMDHTICQPLAAVEERISARRVTTTRPSAIDFAQLALLYPSTWLAKNGSLTVFSAYGGRVETAPSPNDPNAVLRLLCKMLEIDSGLFIVHAIQGEWTLVRHAFVDARREADRARDAALKTIAAGIAADTPLYKLPPDGDSQWTAMLDAIEGNLGRPEPVHNPAEPQHALDQGSDNGTTDNDFDESDATTDDYTDESDAEDSITIELPIAPRHVAPDEHSCKTCSEGIKSKRALPLVADGHQGPAKVSYGIVGYNGVKSRTSTEAERLIIKEAVTVWSKALAIDFVETKRDPTMMIVFDRPANASTDTAKNAYSANGSYCSSRRIGSTGTTKKDAPPVEHDICLRGTDATALIRTATHMVGHFLGLSGTHVGLVNNYLSSGSTIKLDKDASANFAGVLKDESKVVQATALQGSVMDDLTSTGGLALRAIFSPSDVDLAQMALLHPGPQLVDRKRKPTAIFELAMEVFDVPDDVRGSLESALKMQRWSMVKTISDSQRFARRQDLSTRFAKVERRLIRRLPSKSPEPSTKPVPEPPKPGPGPSPKPAPPADDKPKKEHGLNEPTRMHGILDIAQQEALNKAKAKTLKPFPMFKAVLWEKLNSFFGPSGEADSFLSIQSPTRYLDKDEFAYDLEGIYSNFVKPVVVNEAEFRLTDQLFAASRVVGAPNGRSLSMVYEQALNNLIPKYGDEDEDVRKAREDMAKWLLADVADRESLYVNNGDLVDRPDSIITKDEAANAARRAASAVPRKASRMEAAEHFMNTYYNAEIKWKQDKSDIISTAMNSDETVRVKKLEAATRLIANTSAARQAKLSFLYNDAVVRGHLHDVRECMAQLDIKSTAEFLQDAKDSLRESAVASLYGASRILPVIMQPLDWSQGLDTKFAPEDLSSDPEMIQISIESKSKQIDSLRRQLGVMQAHVKEDPTALKERLNNASDELSKAEAALSGMFTENAVFSAGKIIDVAMVLLAPEGAAAEGLAAEGAEASLMDSGAIMNMFTGAQKEGSAAKGEVSNLLNILKALDPKATLEGLAKGIAGVNTAQAGVMKAAAEYSSRQTDWARSMSATTAEQIANVLRQISTASAELDDLKLRYKMAVLARQKRDNQNARLTTDKEAAKRNREAIAKGSGTLKLPKLDQLGYDDEVNATKGGGSRWISITVNSKEKTSTQFTGDTTTTSHSGWDVNLFLAGGGRNSDEEKSENLNTNEQTDVEVTVSMNCTMVTVDRSSWFQPQFFGMSEAFMRNNNNVSWSGKWPDKYQEDKRFDAVKAVKEGVHKDEAIKGGLLTCFPTGYIICKDVLIKISNFACNTAESQKFFHERVTNSGGFLFFRHTSTSETTTSTSSTSFQMAEDGMIVRIPGPQILGYVQQMVPYDYTSKYDKKYALNKAFHLPVVMPPADESVPKPQRAIQPVSKAAAIDDLAKSNSKYRSDRDSGAGEYSEYQNRASGQRVTGSTKRTTKYTNGNGKANGNVYGDTETETDNGDATETKGQGGMSAFDVMPSAAKEALYAYLGEQLGKKGSGRQKR